jgi:hypothetical protein
MVMENVDFQAMSDTLRIAWAANFGMAATSTYLRRMRAARSRRIGRRIGHVMACNLDDVLVPLGAECVV